nr:hypothetical protein [Tanacetum cinerariifolium]
MISKEDSGSKIDLKEIKESTDEEPIVNTNTQQEVVTPVKPDDISLPIHKTSGCKWIFKKKTDMDGKVHTYKASFGMSADEFDKEIGSSDGLQPKQADLSCVHALNKPHVYEINVVT